MAAFLVKLYVSKGGQNYYFLGSPTTGSVKITATGVKLADMAVAAQAEAPLYSVAELLKADILKRVYVLVASSPKHKAQNMVVDGTLDLATLVGQDFVAKKATGNGKILKVINKRDAVFSI